MALSEAYDVFLEMQGTYVICFDMIRMMDINKISYEAGDLALVEVCKRIDEASTDNMLQLRIGGDEFALVTGFSNLEDAQKTAHQILEKNSIPVIWQGQEISVSLRAGFAKSPEKHLKYNELFTDMHNAINEIKKAEKK